MKSKSVSGMMLTLLFVGTLILAFNIQPIKSDWTWTETIYIRADGSIDPNTASISSVDNVTYALTDARACIIDNDGLTGTTIEYILVNALIRSVDDPIGDVSAGFVDIIRGSVLSNGTHLTVIVKLKELPHQLYFDDPETPDSRLEYQWSLYVDVDGDPSTGSPYHKGSEVSISIEHFKSPVRPPKNGTIIDETQQNIWIYNSTTGHWHAEAFITAIEDFSTNSLIMFAPLQLMPWKNSLESSNLLFIASYYHDGEDFAYSHIVNDPPYQPQLLIAPSLAVEDDDDLTVTVTGPTPADPDGDAVTYIYRWLVDVGTGEFVDDEVAGRGDHTGNMVPAADTDAGDVWRVEVTPVDGQGAVGLSGVATWQPVFPPDTINPVANAGPDQTVVEDTVVTFDAGGSSDNVGIVSYEWDFGDGTTGTGITITHTYTKPDIYPVKLTVKNEAGNSDTASIIVTVQRDTDGDGISDITDTDDDNDGIPDVWEIDNGLDPLDVQDASLDLDNDGWTNLQEYLENMNPNVYDAEAIREPRSLYLVAQVAVAGAAVTAVAAALASLGGLGQSFNSAVSKLPIPDKLKDFLKLYGEEIFETVDKAKLEALEEAPFITKGELAALGISALIMTIVFGYVEANGLPDFLDPSVLVRVIPSVLLSACMVSIAGVLSEALCARTCRVYRQFRLWMYGLGAFLISGLLFLFPFASPGITRYQSGEISDKTKGLIVLSKMLILLTLTVPFAGLFMLGFKTVGDAGLLLTLMTVCYSLVPLKPLVGKAVFDYKKEVSLIALVSTGILFCSCTVKLLSHVTYLAVGVVSAFLAAITLNQLRKAHPK